MKNRFEKYFLILHFHFLIMGLCYDRTVCAIILTLCVLTWLTFFVIVLVLVTNITRLSRVSRMALNVVTIAVLKMTMFGLLLFDKVDFQVNHHPLGCKLYGIMSEYLQTALPSTVIVLNVYCFIWIRHPDIDARKNFFSAIVLVPHVVSFLITVGLLAGSVIDAQCPLHRGFDTDRLSEAILLCLDVLAPLVIDLFIITILISISVSLYRKSQMRQGSMRHAMQRRIQIIISVLVLNGVLLFFILLPNVKYIRIRYRVATYFTYLVGHVLMVLWWLVLLPDVRVFLCLSIHSLYERTKSLFLPQQEQRSSIESCSENQVNGPGEHSEQLNSLPEDIPQHLALVNTSSELVTLRDSSVERSNGHQTRNQNVVNEQTRCKPTLSEQTINELTTVLDSQSTVDRSRSKHTRKEKVRNDQTRCKETLTEKTVIELATVLDSDSTVDRTRSRQTRNDQAISKETRTGQVISDQPKSEETVSKQTRNGQVMSGQTSTGRTRNE